MKDILPTATETPSIPYAVTVNALGGKRGRLADRKPYKRAGMFRVSSFNCATPTPHLHHTHKYHDAMYNTIQLSKRD